jgi:uncharacterized metal-binding protein
LRINRSYITNFDQILDASNLAFAYITSSTNTTLTATDGINVHLIDATSGALSVTLPSAVSNNACFIIKKTDSSANVVTIDGASSETIDGDLTYKLNDQFNYVEIVSNGTNWVVVNEFHNEVWT